MIALTLVRSAGALSLLYLMGIFRCSAIAKPNQSGDRISFRYAPVCASVRATSTSRDESPSKGFLGFHELTQATSSPLTRFSGSIRSQFAAPIGAMLALPLETRI